jgi:cell division protein ZapA
MAQVSVTINGRQYRMACEDGQENHLMQLAKDFELRIGELRAKFGEIGDMRLTVMAALTVADELTESAKHIRRLQQELAAVEDARVAAADRAQATQVAIATVFNSAAERIEKVAKSLNDATGNGGIPLG